MMSPASGTRPGTRARITRQLNNYLELWLSLAGIVVIFGVPTILTSQRWGVAYWRIAGITAIVVGALHGLIFWLVRRRQRRMREQTLHQVQRMLADVVNSHLQVITLGLTRHPELVSERRALAKIETAIRRITEAVDAVSVESLRQWQEKYPDH